MKIEGIFIVCDICGKLLKNKSKFKKYKETEKNFHIASLGMETQRGTIFMFNLDIS